MLRIFKELDTKALKTLVTTVLIPAVLIYAMLPGLTDSLPPQVKGVLLYPLLAMQSIPYVNAAPLAGPIQNLTYNYDPVGNITQIADTSITPTAKTSTYGYDDRNFLTSVSTSGFSQGDYTQTYAYDSLANLAYKSDIGTINHFGTGLPGPHAITSIGSDNYTYDLNGNLLFDGDNT